MVWSCALALGPRHALHHVELLAPLQDLLRSQLGEIVEVALPRRVRPPALRAAGALSRTRRASSSVWVWDSTSKGRPAELPSGKSLKRKRGTPQCSTMSFAQPMITVGMPLA